MSIIYDHDAIRERLRMRDAPVAEPTPEAPNPEWVCLYCGFWKVQPKGSACLVSCPICSKWM